LLPAKTRYEQDDGGTETSTERRIMFSPQIQRQVGEARAEWKIVREIAAAAYPERAHLLGCESGWKLRQEMARVVPFYDGVENLKQTGDAFQYGGRHLCAGWKFPTADGRAHFRAVPLPEAGDVVLNVPGAGTEFQQRRAEDGAPHPTFTVTTRRGKQFNSLVYAEVDPINGAPRDAVLMNPEDAAALGLVQSDPIALTNQLGRVAGRVFFAPMARGNLQIHWPEGNIIIRRAVTDPTGGVPDYNARVKVEKLVAARPGSA